VPTDRGYRAFVDRLLAAWPLHRWELTRREQRMVEADLQRTAGTLAVIKVIASLLSRLTANIGIILGPSWESVRALRMDLYPKEGRRVLMVLVLENALVRTAQLRLDEDYPSPVVEEAARVISERIAGRTVAEIRRSILASFDAVASPAGRCASHVARRGRELFEDVEESDVELEGVANVLNEPEFSDPGRLKALVRFLESPRSIRDALQRLSLQAEDGLGIWIGEENPIGELRPFTLLSSRFDLNGRRGVLAVLGPRRMPYRRAFSSIDAVRRTLRVLV
jgi:heat-inducible transcriptional repressor